MPIPSKLLALALVTCFAASPAAAQEYATVALQTNVPEAVAYADTLRLGPASLGRFSVPLDARELTLVVEGERQWTMAPVSTSLEGLAAGSVREVNLSFPYHYNVRSMPYGADVYVVNGGERQRLGETPLLHRSEQPLQGDLEVVRSGYDAQRVLAGREVWNDVQVLLRAPQSAQEAATEVAWTPPRQPRYWIDYAALGLAAAAGIMTVRYKFEADDLYDEYERTGDPALRTRFERLDTRAGVSLGAMQAGLGVLAVRLILRR